MVLQKRLDFGFNGGHAPAMPRSTRSVRRRANFQRRVGGDQMCAFDLLATVAAGKLLQEKENPDIPGDASSEKDQCGFVKECQDANKPLEAELSDEGSCDKKCFSHLSSQTNNQTCCLKELPHPEIDSQAGIASVVTKSSCSERFVAEKLVDGNVHNKMEIFTSNVKLDSSGSPEVSCCKLDGDTSKVRDELHKFEKLPVGTGTEMCSFEEPLARKSPALISLSGNAKLFGYDDGIQCTLLSKNCDNVPVVSRDDDENFSGCNNPCTKTKSFRPVTRIGDRRIRKILASKYRKCSQELKDDTLSNSDGDLKPTYYNKKNYYKRQISQMNIPFKKRKLFNCGVVSNLNGFIRNGGIYYSHENGMNQDASGSSHGMHEGSGISSFEACQHSAFGHRGSHVNLSIKSFRVPELFVEIPETATIGSLKRTVMDAVTSFLGGGLHVGVILQGKKVRDDSETLLQAGISSDKQLDALGFTLEPNNSQSLSPVYAPHSPNVPCADVAQPLIRYPSSPAVPHQRIQGSSDIFPKHQVTSRGNPVESDHDSAPSPINASIDNVMTDSKALATVPEMGAEELAVLPVLQKSKQSEIVQRRIRRPFSVDEVEALVEAVEKLGTGRWRDVKLRAFDDAKHRTYVDLKDKWKTLVHTARISPQQRRGEPVPQGLLDRVLVAQAYWSHQQTQQQHKQ